MKRMTIISALLLIAVCAVTAQKTTRRGLKLKQPVTAQSHAADTVAAETGMILVNGYEKGQSSSTETVFLTNTTDYNVKAVNISVEYLNMDGRQLHQRTETIKEDLPPGQTRQAHFKAWDSQHLWYYYNTQAKHNEYCNPYTVKISVNYLIVKPTTQNLQNK